jgi:hypothetical protein
LRLPHPAFLRAILFRAAGIWIVNRAMLAMVGLTTATVATAILIIALTAWLTAYDGRRSGEDLLLANFGVPEWVLALIAAIPATAFEVIIGALS